MMIHIVPQPASSADSPRLDGVPSAESAAPPPVAAESPLALTRRARRINRELG